MPRSGQIIPKYLQPHEEVYINDNTYYEDYTADLDGPTFLCVFVGGKGRDKLLLKNNWSNFIAEYGYPNFRKWGQAMYMPYTALYNGNCRAYCLRVTAENATYANLILAVGYKLSEGKFVEKFKLYSRTGIRNLDDIDVFANTLEKTTPDEDGYKWVPILSVYSLGKGSYGEDFRLRINHDKNADRENEYKNYSFELLSTEKGTSMIESYNVTFDVEGQDPLTKLTNFIDDIVNDEEGSGSKRVGCHFFSENYQTLFDAFCNAYENNGYIPPTIVKVDRLPSITLPSNTVLYHLTQNDGARAAGGMYVYDTENGVFNASSFSVTEQDAMPDVTSADKNTIWKLTADDSSDASFKAGTSWITTDNLNWIAAPEIIDVAKLPSTTLVEEDTVYELTAADGNKTAGSQWTYDADLGDYIAFVDEGPQAVETPNPYTIATWDMFGYDRFNRTDNELIVIDGGKESLSIMDIEGVGLQSGDDGDFADDVPTAEREAAFEMAYIKAFQGDTDKKILSTRRAPFDLILDACFPFEVKKAMTSLVLQRQDCSLRLDTGLLTNIDDIYDMGKSLQIVNTYHASKNCGMFKTLDPITGKVIPVSITLWLASQYPIHYLRYGNHTPLAGESYAVISGYVNHSIKPDIDADDMDIKEKLLTEYQINYIEALDEDTYVRGTQNTSQVESSDLSEENNVLVLLEIKRRIERMTAERRYRWSEQEDLAMFQESVQEVFSSYVGTKCRSFSVRVDSNAWETTRYIIHVYLEVVFRTFQKRAIIEIDVNPRV